ncbi:MAG: DUF262 domain-containing protein [bacterium]|nr:DUF262 domain-containing protein [bacterium]
MSIDNIFCKTVTSVRLENWMNWASSAIKSTETPKVVLPMIQRGSVWAPHKVLDLWDTLLRGMPIGAMMASVTKDGETIRGIGEKSTTQARSGDIALIDGQQRTLSMLAGWPDGLINPLRPVAIWVDLVDTPQGEYRFRLWATTKAQPFGYTKASRGGQSLAKLKREKLRLANLAWKVRNEQSRNAHFLWEQLDFMPWEAKFAIPLNKLIANAIANEVPLEALIASHLENYKNALRAMQNIFIGNLTRKDDRSDKSSQQIYDAITEKLKDLPEAVSETLIQNLKTALSNVLLCEFPIIHVRQDIYNDEPLTSSDANSIDIDPPLAVLFKRVGTGGEPLSDADYVYSVIKNNFPKVHDLVESLLCDHKICAIYTPTTLVMSAVRFTMINFIDEEKSQKISDSAKLDKAAFARLVRNHPEFICKFTEAIENNGPFSRCLRQVLENLSYDKNKFSTGLPKHALCLVKIPLLEVIMAWVLLLKSPSNEVIERSRLPMARFILQGNLCVFDYAKASEDAIKILIADHQSMQDFAKQAGRDRSNMNEDFPDQILLDLLSEGNKATAYRLPKPEDLEKIHDLNDLSLISTPEEVKGLRGWTRFALKEDADQHQKRHVEIYKRWWKSKGGHVHPMLLWLQRDYVSAKFETVPALAGLDEETPFDFDHILPSAQWANWTGSGKGERFIDYPLKDRAVADETGYWHIGNSIGNIHVLESSENRSIGDASVIEKNQIIEGFEKNALVPDDDKLIWNDASGLETEPRKWKQERALAFQHAVEKRTFALYRKFCADLRCFT